MISVVVVNFNGKDLLQKNLPRLLELLKKLGSEHEVILADDCSTDGSCEYAAGLGLIVSKTEKNSGFSTNVDRAFRQARGEVVFSIKNDAIPADAGYFSLLLKHFDNPKVFAVSAALETIENGKKEVRGQGIIIFHRGFFLHFRTHEDYVAWLQTMRSTRVSGGSVSGGSDPGQGPTLSALSAVSGWPDGGASAFRKDLYLKIGGFDSLYNPFYWEDVDLGWRAWKAGYQIDFEPEARLLHNYEAGAIRKNYAPGQVRAISQRNQFIFVWKNGDWKHLLWYFWWEPYHFAVALKNGDWPFFAAYWQALKRAPAILAARARQRPLSALADEEVLHAFTLARPAGQKPA